MSRSAFAAILLALAPLLLWPGDVPWLIDEPRLIANAWHANRDGTLATTGLAGNFGVRYGPLPTQLYQLLLVATHDPATLVLLRALLCGGVTAFGLLWLARTLRLPAWFAAPILLAPYVTHFHRVLWDASFAVPIGTLALAAFADFVETKRVWPLRLCAVMGALAPMIHPQALPLAVPIAVVLVWRHRAALRADRTALLGLGAVVLALHGVWLVKACGDLAWRLQHSAAAYPGGGSRLHSALAPFLGGNLLSGFEAAEKMVSPRGSHGLVVASQWASQLIYPLIWLGLAVAIRACRDPQPSTRRTLAGVALAGLAVQAILFAALRLPTAPQYYFGTFPLHVLAAWFAIDALHRWRLGCVLGALYCWGVTFITVGGMLAVHHHGYERTGWPTLRDATAVVRELNHFTDTTALTDVPLYQTSPQPIRALRLLLPPHDDEPRASGRLLITRGHVVETDAPPPQARTIDITPLPRDWIPDPATW